MPASGGHNASGASNATPRTRAAVAAASSRATAAAPSGPEAPAPTPTPPSGETLLKKFLTRAAMGTVMFSIFGTIIYLGHLYVCMLVVLLQAAIFRELVNVRYRADCEIIIGNVPLFRTVQWCWYGVATFYTYGDFLLEFTSRRVYLAHLARALHYHQLVSFIMYSGLFVLSIGSLRLKTLKYQVQQLTWTIVTLCLVIGQMKFVAHNIFNGLFWFFFPCFLVISNDCWAYAWGLTCGRRFIKAPFLSLSPNKTWEGFIGAAFSTAIFGFIFAALFARSDWLVCPAEHLTFKPHRGVLVNCVPHPVFQLQNVTVPYEFLGSMLPAAWRSSLPAADAPVMIRPVQLHGVALAIFASVVAPFGGFLASAIKRAYGLKDFDSFIPGHGGVTDRMDCQFLMSLGTFIYYNAFILKMSSVSGLYAYTLLLPEAEQVELYAMLKTHLLEQRLIKS